MSPLGSSIALYHDRGSYGPSYILTTITDVYNLPPPSPHYPLTTFCNGNQECTLFLNMVTESGCSKIHVYFPLPVLLLKVNSSVGHVAFGDCHCMSSKAMGSPAMLSFSPFSTTR